MSNNKISSVDESKFELAMKKLRFIAKILPEHVTDDEDAEVLQQLILGAIAELQQSRVDLAIHDLRPMVVNQN
ncbi:hypothetical protein MM188_003229 [Vibrio cholerae]|nr:hypothetical protein [Vibrio cholerae]